MNYVDVVLVIIQQQKHVQFVQKEHIQMEVNQFVYHVRLMVFVKICQKMNVIKNVHILLLKKVLHNVNIVELENIQIQNILIV